LTAILTRRTARAAQPRRPRRSYQRVSWGAEDGPEPGDAGGWPVSLGAADVVDLLTGDSGVAVRAGEGVRGEPRA